MKTLVLCNQKGGVGKSAVATLLVHLLAHRGRRVLAIDLDHQGNFSKPLRLSGRVAVSPFASDALLTDQAAGTSGPALRAGAGRPSAAWPGAPARATHAIRPELPHFPGRVDSAFDVCVVDTNPNPDIRVIAALVSADFVLSPMQLNQEAMDGVSGLLNHERVGLRKIKAVLNPKLALIGLLPTMVEPTPFQKAELPAGGAAVPPADDPHRRRAGRLRVDPAPLLHRRGPGRRCGAVGDEEDRGARCLARDRAQPGAHRRHRDRYHHEPHGGCTMPLQLDDLAALDAPSPTSNGQPLLLPVARHRRRPGATAARVRCQRPAGVGRDHPPARRAPGHLGAAEPAGSRPLGPEFRGTPAACIQAGRADDDPGVRRRHPPTATTR